MAPEKQSEIDAGSGPALDVEADLTGLQDACDATMQKRENQIRKAIETSEAKLLKVKQFFHSVKDNARILSVTLTSFTEMENIVEARLTNELRAMCLLSNMRTSAAGVSVAMAAYHKATPGQRCPCIKNLVKQLPCATICLRDLADLLGLQASHPVDVTVCADDIMLARNYMDNLRRFSCESLKIPILHSWEYITMFFRETIRL